MTARGRVLAAPVRAGVAAWSAAETVLPTAVDDLGPTPDAGDLLVQMLAADGAPSFDGVRGLQLTPSPIKVAVDTEAPLHFLAWAGFLGLSKRSQRTEIITDHMTVVRSGHVIVCGIRVAVIVGWRVAVQEIGA